MKGPPPPAHRYKLLLFYAMIDIQLLDFKMIGLDHHHHPPLLKADKSFKAPSYVYITPHQSWPYARHYAIIEIHDIDVHTNFTPFSLVVTVNLFSARCSFFLFFLSSFSF